MDTECIHELFVLKLDILTFDVFTSPLVSTVARHSFVFNVRCTCFMSGTSDSRTDRPPTL